MKRAVILPIALVTTLLTITVVGTSNFLTENKHTGHHQAQGNSQNRAPDVDGSVNPNLIPDFAAHEIVFRLISTNSSDDPQRVRKNAYLKLSGFSDAEAAAITNAAFEYKRQTDPLDAQVDNIKNRTWPNPSQQVMDQLAQLETQKEAIIATIVAALQNQLSHYDPSKFRTHIDKEVKRKTKGFRTGLPSKKVSGIRKFISNLFTVSAQAAGCDTLTYIYTTTVVDWTQLAIVTNASYSTPYNNCGHVTTLSTTMMNSGGTVATGGDGAYFSLVDPYGHLLDGYFFSTTEANSFCPVVSQTFYAGSNTSDTTATPYLRVSDFGGFSQNPVRANSLTRISFNISASQNANGPCDVEFGYAVEAGSGPINRFDISGSGRFTFSSGVNREPAGFYTYIPYSTTDGGYPKYIRATAMVTSTVLRVVFPASAQGNVITSGSYLRVDP